MKKSCLGKLHYCLLVVILFSSFSNAWGQGSYDTANWRFSNPKQFGFTVMDLDYYDNNKAIAVGSDGGIAFTTNGGTKWTYGAFTYITPAGIRTKASFQDVHFATPTVAYAVGFFGVMAKSTDGGMTWSFVNTPLYSKARNINAVWFTNKDTGYIGGQYNSADSIPKLYFTHNGGATWDSLNAPIGGKTVVGYVNNPNIAPLQWNITAIEKEIHRIEFINDSVGYVLGSGSNASTYFPPHPAINTTTCLPNGTFTTTSAQNAALLWKFTKGTLTDYSLSKERLGYTGINTTTINCTTRFASIAPQGQTYKAMNIISDSMIVVMSFNNNIVVRIRTGKNDSTLNVNVPGYYENGRYEVLNFPTPPNAAPSIPSPQVLVASNPWYIRRASNGKLFAAAGFGALWTSIDTGRNWVRERSLPPNQNFSNLNTLALDFLPSGKLVTMGALGVVADSIPGGSFQSTYVTVPLTASYFEIEFPDCNNGMAVGGGQITVTTDGGKNWIDRARSDFNAAFLSINGFSFPALNKAWFAVSSFSGAGSVYLSTDQGVTLNPMYNDPLKQFTDIATVGNDSIWVSAYTPSPSTSRTSSIIRSFDNGATWTSIGGFPVGTTVPRLDRIAFPSKNIGYVAGTRNAVYKTTDAGTTWIDISPFPSLNAGPVGFTSVFVAYTDVFALDDNTVFVVGNMFTNVAVQRVYKSTDGGTTWVDITSNIPTFGITANLAGILMHDANNGYVLFGGGMYVTNNGGTSWTLELPPSGSLFRAYGFAPKKVAAGIPMANRRLFIAGANVSGSPIMEYGKLTNLDVNSTETITTASCTNPTGGSITVNSTGGIAPYTYSINGGAFQSSNTFTGLNQGVKTIVIKDNACGTITKNLTVGFTDNLVLTTNNDTAVCAGAPVPMMASTNGTGAAYAWSPSSGLSANNISNPIATVNTPTAYTVNASLNGCVRTKTVNIGVNPNPVVNAGPDHSILLGSSVTLTGSTTGTTQSVLWTPGATLSGANTYTPVATPLATTTYTMTVKDMNNCTSVDSATVTIIPYCAKPMEAFTPNGDGMNDKWLVTTGSCADKVNVSVFNRYGNLVYKKDNYGNDWDGKYNGKDLADGTYYYLVTFRLINGQLVELSGNVTILR